MEATGRMRIYVDGGGTSVLGRESGLVYRALRQPRYFVEVPSTWENGGQDQLCGGIRYRLDNNGEFTDGGVDLRGEGVGRKWEPGSGGGDGAEVRLMKPANLGGRAVGVHVACEGEEGARKVVWVGITLLPCQRKEPVGVSCRPTHDSASGSAGAGE